MEPCFSNEHHHPHHHHHHHNHHHRHDRHQQSPLGLVSKRSHSIIKAIIFTDIINKQWNPQTSTKRPAMGRLGSEIPKCYQFLLGLRFLWERWCCFLKKVGEWSYSNQNNCKDIIWWINIQIPTNHSIPRVDWTRSNHDLYESHLFYVAAHPSHEMRCKKKQEASSSCKWNDLNLKPQQLNAINWYLHLISRKFWSI